MGLGRTGPPPLVLLLFLAQLLKKSSCRCDAVGIDSAEGGGGGGGLTRLEWKVRLLLSALMNLNDISRARVELFTK